MDQYQSDRAREARLRRLALKHDTFIRKSRARSWHLDDQCGYMVCDARFNLVMLGNRFDATLDDIEEWLTR